MCKWRLGSVGLVGPAGLGFLVILLVVMLGGDRAAAQTADPVLVELEATVAATPRSPAAAARYEVNLYYQAVATGRTGRHRDGPG